MAKFNAAQILAAVQAAYATAVAQNPAQRVAFATIADNCRLGVSTYDGSRGSGFQVTATAGAYPNTTSCVMQSGPETERKKNTNLIELLVALLLAEFASFSVGTKAFLESGRVAVAAALQAGDVSKAKEIVSTFPAPTPDLVTAQESLLVLFP